jgi:hypothetical protein
MRWYAERRGRALGQLIVDLLVLVWAIAWVRIAGWVFDLVAKLATPGEKIEDAGHGLTDSLTSAGERVTDVPLVGERLSGPFRSASDASIGIGDAGQSMQDAANGLAWFLAVMIVVLAVGSMLAVWLPLRVHYAMQASAAAALRDSNPDVDLFAMRALNRQPLRRLFAVDPDPAAAWRRGDQVVVRRLADLELRRWGLRAQ